MTTDLLERPATSMWEMTTAERELWSRRRLLGTILGGTVAVGLGACGDDGDGAVAANPDGATTTVAKGRPTRVIALGQGADADALIALGLAPVGMSKAFNDTGIYPWTEAALGGRKVELLDTLETLPLERIAALKPDLIVATTQYSLDRDLATLGRIATVVGPETTADKQAWQQTTRQVGEAVGMATEAGILVDKAEATVAAARDRHPDWAGRTFTFGPVDDLAQLYTVNASDDASASLLAQLGLVLSPAVTALPSTETDGRAPVSLERLDLLDADALLLVYFADEARATLEANPLFAQLPAVRRGSYVDLDRDAAIGLAFPSVLAIPYAVERVEPALTKALAAR